MANEYGDQLRTHCPSTELCEWNSLEFWGFLNLGESEEERKKKREINNIANGWRMDGWRPPVANGPGLSGWRPPVANDSLNGLGFADGDRLLRMRISNRPWLCEWVFFNFVDFLCSYCEWDVWRPCFANHVVILWNWNFFCLQRWIKLIIWVFWEIYLTLNVISV